MSDPGEKKRRRPYTEPVAVVKEPDKSSGFALPKEPEALPAAYVLNHQRIDLDNVYMKTPSRGMIPDISWMIFGKTGFAGKLLGLGEYEQETLRLLLRMLIANDYAGLMRQIEAVNREAVEDVASILVKIAASGRSFCEEETRLLFDVFRTLGLDNAAILKGYAAGGARKKRYADKGAQATKGNDVEIRLDMKVVEEKIRETESLGRILGEIFVDDEGGNCGRVEEVALRGSYALPGLDEGEMAFALMLCGKDIWRREELEEAALKAELMLDGALESINAACYEAFGEALFEGFDPVEINMAVVQEICK